MSDYFEYIIKKHEKMTDTPSLRIYVSKIENMITFELKVYYLELLTSETMNYFEVLKVR